MDELESPSDGRSLAKAGSTRQARASREGRRRVMHGALGKRRPYCSRLAALLARVVRYPCRPSRRDCMTDFPACDAELDASGLNCPLPLLKAKLELNRLASGAVLKVTATDAGSQRDFR